MAELALSGGFKFSPDVKKLIIQRKNSFTEIYT
jgi:hypothetical protein